MKFIVDAHVHSCYSRATSKNLNLEHMCKWAQLKGLQVIGTGDFVHPGWLAELQEKLEPAEEGFFRLKPEFRKTTQPEVPPACEAEVRFLLSVEISNIYKRHDRVRKVHNLIFVPHFEAAEKLQAKLETIGNIRSDGRPILGLDSRDLLEITLETDPLAYFIPAHIWTPWFSALGSKGGFDSLEACFGDLMPYVFAAETGLSSDPPMNWRLSQLDPYILVSNSDAHSPPKLGREATIYDTEFSYRGIYNALSDRSDPGHIGTIEFFPEEGKYHFDGHRACQTRLHPRETRAHNGQCPVCGKPVTVGVMARVEALADRSEADAGEPPRARPFHSLIPLPEIIAEAKNVGTGSKAVQTVFQKMLGTLGNEMFILLEAPLEDIERAAGSLVAEGVRRMRAGEVNIAAGYDGEFGVIKIFQPNEREKLARQTSFLPDEPPQEKHGRASPFPDTAAAAFNSAPYPAPEPGAAAPAIIADRPVVSVPAPADLQIGNLLPEDLNAAQWRVVTHTGSHLLVVAGPGTGKTHTLTHRIAHIAQCFAPAEKILAVTFTNKAAEELRHRLALRLPDDISQLTIGTFHSFCLHFLRQHLAHTSLPPGFGLATEHDLERAAQQAWPQASALERKQQRNEVSAWKARGHTGPAPEPVQAYNVALRSRALLDFDDLILESLRLLRKHAPEKPQLRTQFAYIFVDEYQDISASQHALLQELVHADALLTAIGDPNQGIYGFRGADIAFFHSFAEDFPDAKILHLADNYRSTQHILDASGQVIAKEKQPGLPGLTAKIAAKGQLTIHETPTDKSEAEYVVHQIEKLVGGTSMFSQDSGRVASEQESERSFGDIAVLYRLNSQRHALEEAFERSGIPFQVSGDKPLLAQTGVSHILSTLQLAGDGRLPITRALELLQYLIEGLGAQTVAVLRRELPGENQHVQVENLRRLLSGRALAGERVRARLRQLLDEVEALQEKLRDEGVVASLQHLIVTAAWQAKFAREARLKQNWQRLLRLARLCTGLPDFVDALHLERGIDGLNPQAEQVSLLTLHAAKGLEFPIVFITGCEQHLLPLQLEGYTSDPSEERRLFYVGMTRAKEHLFLTYARKRTLFGKTRKPAPSPFLADIEEALKYYDVVERKLPARAKKAAAQLDLFG